ncbi:MAG TPA: SGNH/GDSL hydrolase family protein [Xanthomonadales bacterium]|nr:SGNH/GDSL hydrolase family protein [Xanthomonadales bacterium]
MIRNLLFWLAFPLLIPQALHVQRTAPRFAHAGGPTKGVVGEGERKRLLAIGDSIIAGVGASELGKALVGRTAASLADIRNCQVEWQALGVSGYDASDILKLLVPQLPEYQFDHVIVSVGVNDITGLTGIRTWKRNLSKILEHLEAHSPGAIIAVAGSPPMHRFPLLPQPLRAVFGMRARVFDEATKAVIVDHARAIHIPLDFEPDPDEFSPDGYHPSEESYVEFGRHMAKALIGRR